MVKRMSHPLLIHSTLLMLLAVCTLSSPVIAQQAVSQSASCQVSSLWCVDPAQKPTRSDYVKDEVLLLHDSSKPEDFIERILVKFNLREKSNNKLVSIKSALVTANTNGRDPLALSQAINQQEKEVEADTNNLFFTAAQNTPPRSTYPLSLTGIEAAHKYTKGEGIKICMIDTPIDILHRSLDNSRVQRLELVAAGNARNQQHGTEVAGVIISQNPRIGVAPEATLLSVSTFSTDAKKPGQHTSNARLVARALDMCIREKVDIMNLSFAGGPDKLVNKMIDKAVGEGIVVVASAGNGGRGAEPAYPAAIPSVIAVTAVDATSMLFGRANRGSYIDLAAPGVNILTTSPRGSFNLSTGTSLATAHVSGVVALLMAMNRQSFSPLLLERTAVDLGNKGRDTDFGHGLVNVRKALESLR